MRTPVLSLLAALSTACGGAATPSTEPSTPTEEPPSGRVAGAVTPEMGSPNVGDRAPDFELTDADGVRVKLSELRGEVVVLHFGASWCPYCGAELPNLHALAEEYGDRIRVLLVDVKERGEAYESYRTRSPVRFPFLRDLDGRVSASYAPEGALPSFHDRAQVTIASNLIVDREGIIRFYTLLDSAAFDAELVGLRRALDRVLEEQPAPEDPTVVEVRVGEPTWDDARTGSIEVILEIADGYHVMSDRPSRPELIATEVTVTPDGESLEVGEPTYPDPVDFAVGRESISTFEGTVRVRVPLRLVGAPDGAVPASLRVSYQACTARNCLFPREETTRVAIESPSTGG